MGRDDNDDTSSGNNNVFVRFKHHVDANVSSGFKTILGSPPSRHQSSTPSEPSPDSEPIFSRPPIRSEAQANTMDEFSDKERALAKADLNMSLLAMADYQYSPIALRHLPQPYPNDIEPNMDRSLFGFEDAFEDLLAVSQGQELPSITTRYQQNKLLRLMYPNGEPPHFWIDRLKAQGLIRMPRFSPFFDFSTGFNPGSLHQELERRANRAWGHDLAEEEDEDEFSAMFRNLASTFKAVERAFSPPTPPEDQAPEPGSQKKLPEPDHYDDLFDNVRSKWADDSNRSWDTLVKTINDGPSTAIQKTEPQTHNQEQREVRNEEKYVDRFGYLHSTVTVKTLDKDGNQIGTSTHYSMRPADESEKLQNPQKAGEEGQETTQRPNKVGWFWR